MKLSRRDLFKQGVKTTVAAGIGTLALPQVVKGATGNEFATLIDISKCIGCESCVYACQEANDAHFPKPKKPFPKMYPKRVKVTDWSDKRDVTDRLTPYNWLYIQRAEVTINGEDQELNMPRRCMHCQNPPCANLCPWGSAVKHDNGTTTIDSDTCMGGAKCKAVCPWDIPQRQTGTGFYLEVAPSLAGNGVMYKCSRCHDKTKKGESPACIEACSENVQKIGPRDEIIKEAKARAKEMNGYLYGLEENGGTNTIYISPVPFNEIDNSIEKGDGKPHFDQVNDTMASADMLSKAMLIAPFIGIAAAFNKSFKKIVQMKDRDGE